MHFFDLPAELRNRIYDYAIPSDQTYTTDIVACANKRKDDDDNHAIRFPPPPGFVRTCRQARKETLPMWRANNAFLLHGNTILTLKDTETGIRTRLEHLSNSGLEHVHEIHLHGFKHARRQFGCNRTHCSLETCLVIRGSTWSRSGTRGFRNESITRGHELSAVDMRALAWVAIVEEFTGKKYINDQTEPSCGWVPALS